VTSSNPALLETLTAAGHIPVVACVAGGSNGEVFNVNGDSMAVAVASAWKAGRLLFLTDVPGVLDETKSLLPELTAEHCRQLIQDGIATGGMQAKLEAAMSAVSHGVEEVLIVRGSDPDIVSRVFAGENIGTKILPAAVGAFGGIHVLRGVQK
jgi:acetylglutamate kinase